MSNQAIVENEVTLDDSELKSSDVELSYDVLYNALTEHINELYSNIKTIKNNLKNLEKSHKKELKMSKKYRKSKRLNNENKKPSGFNKPKPVPTEIINLLGLEKGAELPRTKITKLIYGYIKDNKLQSPEDKRTILPDAKLKKLFNLKKDEAVTFYNIQTHIKKVYPETITTTTTTTETITETATTPVTTTASKSKKTASKKK